MATTEKKWDPVTRYVLEPESNTKSHEDVCLLRSRHDVLVSAGFLGEVPLSLSFSLLDWKDGAVSTFVSSTRIRTPWCTVS